MSTADLRADLDALTTKLRSDRLVYFPIRHHSPACAAHLDRLLRTLRPVRVLIEGPASFDPWIDALIDPRCKPPVALYTTYTEPRARGEDARAAGGLRGEPARHGAFHPFCAHSPEYVALTTGAEIGATLRFIDLDYDEMIRVDQARSERSTGPESLAADPHLLHSAYIRELARALGCRDHDDVWDHLFESRALDRDTDAFIDALTVYCALARRSYDRRSLEADGTLAREARMAAHIREAVEDTDGSVVVVTGGFHTVALPDLVVSSAPDAAIKAAPAGASTGTWLIRYSFDRLDSFSGYGAGMPSPRYYDAAWRKLNDRAVEGDPDLAEVCAELLVDVVHRSRARGWTTTLSTADAIAALAQARNLAVLRRHPWPLRQDVLDAVQSCFVKDASEGGDPVAALAQVVLTGDRIGETPPVDAPPILADFTTEAARLGIELTSPEKPFGLDLYRNRRDRQRSRWFHRLDYLAVPFATFESGPDFVRGHGLGLMQERWSVRWSPMVEGALIDHAMLGESVRAAAGARLRDEVRALTAAGEGRSARSAVVLLTRACQLGLHDDIEAILATVVDNVAEDAFLPSVVQAAVMLELLLTSREPLEAGDLPAVPALLRTTFRRACRLIPEAATCPDEVVRETLDALSALRELAASALTSDASGSDASGGDVSGGDAGLDPALFRAAVARVLDDRRPSVQPALVGAAAGILFAEGEIGESALERTVLGYVEGAREIHQVCGVLQGLLHVAREAVWQLRGLLDALTARLTEWSEEDFRRALPGLRLAFSGLTPRETLKVAGALTAALDGADVGALVSPHFSERDLEVGMAIETQVDAVLEQDGLAEDAT